jgi:hypothetical protein
MGVALVMALGASNLREESPTSLYRTLFWAEAWAGCQTGDDWAAAATDERLRERAVELQPWLIAEIGEAEFRKLADNLDEQSHSIDFIRCPSPAERERNNSRRKRVLSEMTRRAGSAQ